MSRMRQLELILFNMLHVHERLQQSYYNLNVKQIIL